MPGIASDWRVVGHEQVRAGVSGYSDPRHPSTHHEIGCHGDIVVWELWLESSGNNVQTLGSIDIEKRHGKYDEWKCEWKLSGSRHVLLGNIRGARCWLVIADRKSLLVHIARFCCRMFVFYVVTTRK